MRVQAQLNILQTVVCLKKQFSGLFPHPEWVRYAWVNCCIRMFFHSSAFQDLYCEAFVMCLYFKCWVVANKLFNFGCELVPRCWTTSQQVCLLLTCDYWWHFSDQCSCYVKPPLKNEVMDIFIPATKRLVQRVGNVCFWLQKQLSSFFCSYCKSLLNLCLCFHLVFDIIDFILKYMPIHSVEMQPWFSWRFPFQSIGPATATSHW